LLLLLLLLFFFFTIFFFSRKWRLFQATMSATPLLLVFPKQHRFTAAADEGEHSKHTNTEQEEEDKKVILNVGRACNNESRFPSLRYA
jgi:hypothetical protein